MRTDLSILLALFLTAGLALTAEPIQTVGFARHPLTIGAAKELKSSLDRARDVYTTALQKARLDAVKAARDDEVQRIDKAISGTGTGSFSTPAARDAYKSFHTKLLDADRLLLANLSAARNKAKLQGDNANALYLDSLAVQMKKFIDLAGEENAAARRSFRVSADKDFQDFDLMIPAGAKLTVSVSGSWAPGNANRRYTIRSADADTYPVLVQIGSQQFRCPRNSKFTVRDGGALKARMAAHQQRFISNARGSVLLSLEYQAPAQGADANTMERALRELSEQTAAGVGAGGAYQMELLPDKDWQKTGITVKRGQKIEIDANGVWTTDVNNKKLLYRDADSLNYQIRIGGLYHGPCGNQTILIARHDGEIEVRSGFSTYCQKRNFTPGGKLTLKFAVSNPTN